MLIPFKPVIDDGKWVCFACRDPLGRAFHFVRGQSNRHALPIHFPQPDIPVLHEPPPPEPRGVKTPHRLIAASEPPSLPSRHSGQSEASSHPARRERKQGSRSCSSLSIPGWSALFSR